MRRRPPRATRTDTLFPYTTLFRSEFRSLWVVQDAGARLPASPIVHAVRPLLKALIVEIADLPRDGDGYAGRVTQLILDQLRRAAPIPAALSWRRDEALAELCVALYADHRSAGQWARALGMSSRTLSRRFETEIGMRSEEHTSELQSLMRISYAVFC